jgi:hypothetical protein
MREYQKKEKGDGDLELDDPGYPVGSFFGSETADAWMEEGN